MTVSRWLKSGAMPPAFRFRRLLVRDIAERSVDPDGAAVDVFGAAGGMDLDTVMAGRLPRGFEDVACARQEAFSAARVMSARLSGASNRTALPAVG
jgi:hypothetical protein